MGGIGIKGRVGVVTTALALTILSAPAPSALAATQNGAGQDTQTYESQRETWAESLSAGDAEEERDGSMSVSYSVEADAATSEVAASRTGMGTVDTATRSYGKTGSSVTGLLLCAAGAGAAGTACIGAGLGRRRTGEGDRR